MIAKLKSECGNQFTQNIEGMFRDMEVARDTSSVNGSGPAAAAGPSSRGLSPSGPDDGSGPGPTSRAAAAAVASVSGRGAGVDFHPVVLTQQFWPSQTPLDLDLPEVRGLEHAWAMGFWDNGRGHRAGAWDHKGVWGYGVTREHVGVYPQVLVETDRQRSCISTTVEGMGVLCGSVQEHGGYKQALGAMGAWGEWEYDGVATPCS